jgi:patched 1 protein
VKPGLNRAEWNPGQAGHIAAEWQRAYIQHIFNHPMNLEPKGVARTIHPFAITTLSDMLEQFSQFNFTIVFFGYGIMV